LALKHGDTQPLLIPLSEDTPARRARRITVHLAISDPVLESAAFNLLGRVTKFSVVKGTIGYAAESDVRVIDTRPDPDQQRELDEQKPPKLIFLGAVRNDRSLIECAKAGAWAFVAESEGDEVLEQTITAVVESAGSLLLRQLGNSETGSKILLSELSTRPETKTRSSAVRNPLTDREVQILELIARGEPSKNIGEIVRLGEQTVKNYVVKIFEKTHTHNRAHAAAVAAQRGWLSPLDSF